MNKLLYLSTYGLKNIERPIVLEFANQTISKEIKKVNSIKGIYGYNGAGKTALIKSVDFYKKIIIDPDYLIQNETQYQLRELINKKVNTFYFCCIFATGNDFVIRHSLKLMLNPENRFVSVESEKIEKSGGRTLNDKFVTLIENDKGKLFVHPKYDCENIEMIKTLPLNRTSFVPGFLAKLVEKINSDDGVRVTTQLEGILLSQFLNGRLIEVCTLNSEDYKSNLISDSQIKELLKSYKDLGDVNILEKLGLNSNEERIPVSEFREFKQSIKGLERFLKIFKPELNEIKLDYSINSDYYIVKKIFVYKDYKVDFKFESSGIQQLTHLYWYLKKCSDGYLVFVDEMDVNINSVYFKKLVSYFTNFAKGQLIFTTHNVESMEVLKNQKRSISVIGHDGYVDTWVGKGNRSPINDYMGGYFEHSPMNVEDFDFVNVFEGD